MIWRYDNTLLYQILINKKREHLYGPVEDVNTYLLMWTVEIIKILRTYNCYPEYEDSEGSIRGFMPHRIDFE